MKRIVSMALCALLLLGTAPAVRAQEDAVAIGSREDMLKIAADPAGTYELTADIDMGGEPWTPIPFSGVLKGNGHGLYNLTVLAPGAETAATYDGNHREFDTVFGGLFSVVKNAKIRDLALVDAVVDIGTDRHCFVGALAGYAAGSDISGCSVTARNHLTVSSVNAGVAGVVGFSVDNRITDCAVDAELIFTDVNRDQLCEEFLGGVYSSGCGDVKNCSVRLRGFAEVYGYAHNGGVIGMIKLPRGFRKLCTLSETTVEADISFFEITSSRRAYCAPLIGENLAGNCRTVKNRVISFQRSEAREPVRLAPEKCETPRYEDVVTAPACDAWGFTTHTCAGCGYSYRDSYTPPAHRYEAEVTTAPACTREGVRTFTCALCAHSYTEAVPAMGHEYAETVTAPACVEPGERVFTCARCGDRYTEPIPAAGHTPGDWVLTQAPRADAPGEEQRRCSVCGEVLDRREVSALPYVHAEEVTLSAAALELTVGQAARLTATLSPADVTEPALTFRSSDESVVKTGPDGAVQAVGPGTATISCVSADGRASAGCAVTVTRTPWQWVQRYVLFGWIWE